MKKTFLAMLMAGCSCAVFAQDDSLKTLSSDVNYNAYSTFTATPPESVNYYILRDYPDAATSIRWYQAYPDWWHGYYVENNQPMHVYYTTSFHVPTAGQSITVALPVRQSYVPDAVVAKSVELFGPNLYDISAYKGADKEDVYLVRVLENGVISNQYIYENGSKALDVYRIETVDSNAGMSNMQSSTISSSTDASMNTDANITDASTQGKMKMKTKNSDGTESKTKIKNGKVKTKDY